MANTAGEHIFANDLWLRARLWCSLRLSISRKRSSSTEVKFLWRHCPKQSQCRTQTNLERLYKLRTAVLCKHIFSLVSVATNIHNVLSVLPIKRTNRIYLRVGKKYQPIRARGSDLDPGVCMKVRFKSKVTRSFSFSPLRDSCSPLRDSRSPLRGSRTAPTNTVKNKKNLWDQGN